MDSLVQSKRDVAMKKWFKKLIKIEQLTFLIAYASGRFFIPSIPMLVNKII
jgi:hypothetical protein